MCIYHYFVYQHEKCAHQQLNARTCECVQTPMYTNVHVIHKVYESFTPPSGGENLPPYGVGGPHAYMTYMPAGHKLIAGGVRLRSSTGLRVP